MTANSRSGNLCTSCSMCCDGTLFTRIGVSQQEKELLDEKGAFYSKKNGEIRMQLGCGYLADDGRCECYDHRPELCRGYACDLLRSVEEGITSLPDALAIVEEAITLRDKSIKASQSAIMAGGASIDDATTVDALIEKVEDQLKMCAPIPAPAVELAKYRYRSFVHWVRLYIKDDHLK
ncbi:MAG: YkgJ family cysteine cluster protein [Synechococcaceae cyanobacterium]|nr:YkgJ family cysteine cluster protein [Synechococcaceae cyanobacterium]